MKKYNLFASSGSCTAKEMKVYGTVNGITFTSKEFTGTMDGQHFWEELKSFAKNNNAFVELLY